MSIPIWYEYDKITDDLIFLGNGGIIQMIVQLSNRDKNGIRESFHHEYAYIKNGENLNSIKRNYRFFMAISKPYDKASVMVTINDIILFREKINRACKWFDDGTFVIKNNELKLMNASRKIVAISGLMESKWVTLNPVIIIKEDQTQIMGIRMNLYDTSFIDITIDNFYGMKYLFETIDMFTLASNMVSYLGRPEFGTNMTSFRMDDELTIPPTNKKGGFFSK